MERIHSKICVLYCSCFALLLFATYPVALIPPIFASLAYHISIPSLFVLTLFSLPVILSAPTRPKPSLLVCIGLFTASVFYHAVRAPATLVSGVELLGFMTLPLAAAMIAEPRNKTVFTRLCRLGIVLWSVLIAYGFVSAYFNHDVTGFSGNRNWMASVLIAITPWARHAMRNWLRVRCHGGFLHKIIGAVSWCIVLVPTAFLVHRCASRGAWLGLIVFVAITFAYDFLSTLAVFIRSVLKLQKRRKWIVVGQLLMLAGLIAMSCWLLLLFLVSPPILAKVERTIKEDVRIPLWAGTGHMIRDHDVVVSTFLNAIADRPEKRAARKGVSGIGPGEFTKRFSEYRSHSTYHQRLVAAPVTVHPHNEFLNIAAQLGSIPALAWLIPALVLLLPIRPRNLLTRYGRFSAFIIYFHSLFDMPLVKSPGNLIAFFCLGLCWQNRLSPVKSCSEDSIAFRVRKSLVSLSLLILLLAGCAVVFKDLRLDYHSRQGYLAEIKGKSQEAFDHYIASTRIDPTYIRAHLYAASVAMEQLKEPHRALPLLQKAYELDPNFSHINGMVGKCLFRLGMHDQAHHYYVRECQLYPRSPRAFQSYLICSAFLGEYERVEIIQRYLRDLYLEKISLQYSEAEIRRRVRAWFVHSAESRPKEAIAMANELCAPIHKVFMDPLFYLRVADQDWPQDALVRDFNFLDFIYWRQIVLARSLSQNALGANPPADDDQQKIERLHGYLSANVAIDPSDDEFRLPNQSWMHRTCNPLSYLCLFAATAKQCGLNAALVGTLDGDYESCIVTSDDAIMRINIQGDLKSWTRDEVDPQSNRTLALNNGDRPVFFFFSQELWLRNQILGTLIKEYGDDVMPVFDSLPIVTASRTMSAVHPGTKYPVHALNEMILDETDELFLEKIKDLEP